MLTFASSYIPSQQDFMRGKSQQRIEDERYNAIKLQAFRLLLLIVVGFLCYWLPQALLGPEFHQHGTYDEVQTVEKKIQQQQKMKNTESINIATAANVNMTKTAAMNTTSTIAVNDDNNNTVSQDLSADIEFDIAVYQFSSNVSTNHSNEPDFLSSVDLTTLLPNKHRPFVSIDEAHLKGYIHHGIYVFVIDSEQQILMLKRESNVVTCPNSWGLMGEHSRYAESINATLKRGIQEELGTQIWDDYVINFTNLTENDQPVYFYQEFGPSNGNRIDRQITWLMQVQMNGTDKELENIIQFDDEVATSEWYTKDQLEKWINDVPDNFCDSSKRDLLLYGLDKIP